MEQEPLHQPHDKLLKATLSNLENARSFFELYLPQELLAHLDWSSLSLLPSSFVDADFAASESDLLFSVNLGETPSLLYLLLEHQSTEDPRIAFRLLAYIVRIWERFIQSNPPPAKLPPVFPLVLVQGRTPWKTSTRLKDLLADLPFLKEGARSWQPSFEFCMEELARTPFENFKGTPESVLMLRLLKAAAAGELLCDWVWDEGLFARISPDALELYVRYIFDADIDRTVFTQRLENLQSAFMNAKSMTLAQQFVELGKEEGRSEGRQEGWEEGREEGRMRGLVEAARQAVLQALELKHGRGTEELGERLGTVTDLQRLQKLHQNAILCSSEQEFILHL